MFRTLNALCKVLLASSLSLSATLALADGEEGMFVDIKINQVQRGAFAVYRNSEGDCFVRLADFAELGLRADTNLPRTRIEGESGSFVSLRELGATKLDLDLKGLTLQVELPPTLFAGGSVDLNSQRASRGLPSERSSGFVNYRLSDAGYGSGNSRKTLATELGLRYKELLFLNQSLTEENGATSRFLTQLVYDRPATQQRVIGGDFSATSGELGSSLQMSGLNLSKVYSLSPDLIRQPLAGFAGVANSPSQVEVRVGGVPVASSQVATGPFELQNLRQYGGAKDVQVVVRDALGREQVYEFPFYFSEQSLREGMHEYSYSLGKIRLSAGTPNEYFGPAAYSVFHRFGYSDTLTIGARAEGAEGLNNAGLSANWRSNAWGVLAAAASVSSYQGRDGTAAMLAYTYQQSKFGLQTIARAYSKDYAPLEATVFSFNRRAEYGVSASWIPALGQSLSFSQTVTQSRNVEDSTTINVSYNASLSPVSLLYATLQRTEGGGASPNNSLFVGWIYRMGGKYTASVNATRDESGQQTAITQLAKDTPFGEGVGYRVGWTGTQPGNTDRFDGHVQWNLAALSLTADTNTTPSLGTRADFHEIAAAGSIAFAGDAWGLSRQIGDSFAIVRMGVPLADVRVASNSQDIGVTDANGQVISPFLGSYFESRVSMNDKDVPMNYVMCKDFANLMPQYRSGVLVDFNLRRVQAVDGVLLQRGKNGTTTADSQLVTLGRDGQLLQEFQVGREGHFYLENIAQGIYQGEIKGPDHSCHFTLTVPSTTEVVYTLPEELVCE